MKKQLMRGAAAAAVLFAAGLPAIAQSLDDLNIQIHGYATQGFLYTTQNNILTTSSSNGSPQWSEVVLNITSQPDPKLRIGVQGRYMVLGTVGNQITLDWASIDYRVNDKFGVRFGKVKVPSTLFNETQDIDPSYTFALLPQSVYPILSRNSTLAMFGGVVYGTVDLEGMGRIEYRAFGGETVMASNDGYFINQSESGITFTNGLSGSGLGGTLHWRTPIRGLMVGASDKHDNNWSAGLTDTNPLFAYLQLPTTLPGTEILNHFNTQSFYARYDKKKLMAAAEWVRLPVTGGVDIEYLPAAPFRADERSWYGMATYKLTGKLTAGGYDSQMIDHQAALGPARYSKDWTASGRYDLNQYLYLKAEEHFIDGTAIGYDTDQNEPTRALPSGLQPSTRLTVLKAGVSF